MKSTTFKLHMILKPSVPYFRAAMLKEAIRNSGGMALVLTLMVMTIITAMVIEFSYGIYIQTSALHNWQVSQRLSLVAKSGVKIASKTISEKANRYPYTYPGILDISPKNPFEIFGGTMSIRIEDENSKFNLNSLVLPNGMLNEYAFKSFVRLLETLGLNPDLAARIADWIDPDTEPRLPESEKNAKNRNLDSVDELLLIPRIDKAGYDNLFPHVTIYGNGLININGAGIPVLISLSDSIDQEMAERIVGYRDYSPFEKAEDILRVAGFETIGQSLMGHITAQGTAFRVVSTAKEGDILRIIETVLEMTGGSPIVSHWEEI